MDESNSNDGEGARSELKIQVVTVNGDVIFEIKIPIMPSEPLEPEAKAANEEPPTDFSPSLAELEYEASKNTARDQHHCIPCLLRHMGRDSA